MRYVILGTAGHIDHGKSSLVKALTGIDPDRLKEEKERGITIDLGFADLSYPDGLTVGIVDVPGHERLVRNMLAGAGGIDLVLLVIAADEGVMPQSREHLAICNLLRIKSGLIALTKTDMVDPEWLALVRDEVREFVLGTFLEGAEIVPVSAKTGENLEVLREKIRLAALAVEPKPVREILRLPIDRVFSLKGFGTVVTGTLFSGTLSVDDTVAVLPTGLTTKVRGLHSHGKVLQTAMAGQRVAINLQGIDKDEIRRGDVVVSPDRVAPTRLLDARIELLKDSPPVKSKSLVHFHMTTSETIARVILYDRDTLEPGESSFCQLRLADPIVAFSGDRFIIRRYSPVVTIGGGSVLDPTPGRRRRKEGVADLEVLEKGSLGEKIAAKIRKSGIIGSDLPSVAGWIRAEIPSIEEAVKKLKAEKKLFQVDARLFHREVYDGLAGKVSEILGSFHRRNPMSTGMQKDELRAAVKLQPDLWNSFLASLGTVAVERDSVRLKDFKVVTSDADSSTAKLLEKLERAKFQPPTKEELAADLALPLKTVGDLLKLLHKEGKAMRINDSLYLSSAAYGEMIAALRAFAAKQPTMTVAEFRDILNTSRKYALPFLEYLDSNKMTLRVGDVRKFLLK